MLNTNVIGKFWKAVAPFVYLIYTICICELNYSNSIPCAVIHSTIKDRNQNRQATDQIPTELDLAPLWSFATFWSIYILQYKQMCLKCFLNTSFDRHQCQKTLCKVWNSHVWHNVSPMCVMFVFWWVIKHLSVWVCHIYWPLLFDTLIYTSLLKNFTLGNSINHWN